MKNADLQEYYQRLSVDFDKYIQMEVISKNGKTKKERENAKSRLSYILQGFEIYVERNPQLLDFITSSGVNKYPNYEILDEFLTHRFFKSDLEQLLFYLKEEIDKEE